MEKYIDLEKIAAEYDPNNTSPAEQRLADVVVAAIRELAPNAVEQSGKKDHEYGVYTQEELETPLTFEAKEDNTKIYFLAYDAQDQTRTIEVSTDDGKTWTEFTSETYDEGNNTPIATLNERQKVLVRGDNPNGMGMGNQDYYSAGSFWINGEAYVYGNIMSLLSKEDFASMKEVPEYAFASLFIDYDNLSWENSDSLFSHPTKKLLLPATTLADSCYIQMFQKCANMITAPELPATTLAENCYYYMFADCTSLNFAPKQLPATTLAGNCYANMFCNCKSLTTAPKLPATTLADWCYDRMFYNCSSLTTAPELPATTLAQYCYASMFSDCKSLTTAPKLPATTLASNCYAYMFDDCTSLTIAPELPATTLANACYSGMFQGCTSLTVAPKLPATTLARECYNNMFSNCTNLTAAPELPATTLIDNCYDSMFYNCSRLSFIKCAFTTVAGVSYTSNWVANTFPVGLILKKNTWATAGNNGIPSGWAARNY